MGNIMSFIPKLSWDDVVDQFDNLIKFAAKQQSEKNQYMDKMLSAEDLYQEGMIKLYNCWEIWCNDPKNDKDMEEFGPIFRVSLFRHVKNEGCKKTFNYVDLEDAIFNIEGESGEDVVERMYRENGLRHLREMLTSPIASRLLEELIEPSEETMFQVYADMERKKMLKSQGKRVNIPKDTTVRMKHIQRALQITSKQYDKAMEEIRLMAPQALEIS